MKRVHINETGEDGQGRKIYLATNKGGDELGVITFYPTWKRWTWEQNDGIVMSRGCLSEVVRFIETLEGGTR